MVAVEATTGRLSLSEWWERVGKARLLIACASNGRGCRCWLGAEGVPGVLCSTHNPPCLIVCNVRVCVVHGCVLYMYMRMCRRPVPGGMMANPRQAPAVGTASSLQTSGSMSGQDADVAGLLLALHGQP